MIDLTLFEDSIKFPSYDVIKTHFGYFFNQLLADNELKDVDKERCLNTLCGIKAGMSPELFHQESNNVFFYTNKLLGVECHVVDNLNPFVRISDAAAFISWISEITGIVASNTSAKVKELMYARDDDARRLLLKSFLNNKAVKSSYENEKNCLKYFGLETWAGKDGPKLRDAYLTFYKGIQWSFPMPSSEDIFANQIAIQKLPCRAGIMGASKKIIFTHKLSADYNVRKPTSFDAGFYEQFLPNGLTKPLDSCMTETGFEEFVHTPNQFFNINPNLYETF
ncbi:hypothetical protein [Mucilaginibacter pedocola]|uniref:Uncharacterized protein n=1 Tax=Mucilaginibacter pedocola TaxID=1792845 RepID=A0A1S9PBV1_9SPHI|nr:hypothetical protein [Mucilaginibacter pedocola]OOQ58277.1 hypothetical protein BC343_11625 [Mucilaginibacter pedocola]